MARSSYDRNARLEESIRSVLAELLLREIKDPRLEAVTISSVKLSADRSHSSVYFSVIGDAERERQAADGFAAAASFLRRELGQRMRMRVLPELKFLRDTSYEYGDHMERVLDRLRQEGLIPPPQDDDSSTEDDE
jgi:ribosome-binding factor A